MIQYIIQPGDNLYTISLRFQTCITTLMQVNHMSDPNQVYPGQILKIPLPFSSGGESSQFPELSKGNAGPFVLLLQSQLARFGYYRGSMDGNYTNVTEGSVLQFQRSRNLQPTGLVDITTWKVLLDDVRGSLNAPPYHSDMVLSGLFLLLSVDKPAYKSGDDITLSLMKINLSGETIRLNYNTSQRYDFKLTHPTGRSLWRWSDDRSFTQVLGSVSIHPGQMIHYTAKTTLPPIEESGIYHVLGWNTAKQINHIKLHVMIR